MRLLLVTDAWHPQVNGVVTTLVEVVRGMALRGHEVELIEPSGFKRFACPGYREIELAWRPGREVARRLDAASFDAIHIATEGPLGAAARAHCLKRGWAFSTAFHTRFPDILNRALGIPERWGYAWLRRFHAPSASVMVPTLGMLGVLREHRFERLREWSHGVDLQVFRPPEAAREGEADTGLPRPHFLYVGRVSYEKNVDAFLSLDLPGSKLVYGVGPRRKVLQQRYAGAVWHGVVDRTELPAIYGSADVLVFPSRSDTFGLVMLEAMACGTPVAAYPVPGPLDVVGTSEGGVLDEDLKHAALQALQAPRSAARERALEFDWSIACERFVELLVPRTPPVRAAG